MGRCIAWMKSFCIFLSDLFYLLFVGYLIIAIVWRYDVYDVVFDALMPANFGNTMRIVILVFFLVLACLGIYFEREQEKAIEGERVDEKVVFPERKRGVLRTILSIWIFLVLTKYRNISMLLDFVGWKGLGGREYSIPIVVLLMLLFYLGYRALQKRV